MTQKNVYYDEEYRIWKEESGDYYLAVRKTGEITPITVEVFRIFDEERQRQRKQYRERPGMCLSLDDESGCLQELPEPDDAITRTRIRLESEELLRSLTKEQKEVLAGMLRRESNQALSKQLKRSRESIKRTKRQILRKAKRFLERD